MKNSRIKDLQDLLKDSGLDGFVVSDPLDQGFLTGYFMSGYFLLVTRKKAYGFVKTMLAQQFKEHVSSCEVIHSVEMLKDLLAFAPKLKLKKLGFDAAKEKYAAGKKWIENKFIPAPSLVDILRQVKKGEELESVRKSCKIAAKAFEIIKRKIKPGRTEKSVALELEFLMRSMGAEKVSFDLIIAGGPNSALPHHITGDRKIKNNEPLLLDFGCVYDHYCSDMTRTFWLGKNPSPVFKKIHGIVLDAYNASEKATRAGALARDIDLASRDLITKAGYGDKFTHGLGHGVGLQIHEPPWCNKLSDETLKEGMTMTIEPGIYLYGKFGVRHENTVLVRKNNAEVLTKK